MPDLLRNFKIEKSPAELYKIFHWIDLDQSFKIDKKEFENFIWDEWKRGADKKVTLYTRMWKFVFLGGDFLKMIMIL